MTKIHNQDKYIPKDLSFGKKPPISLVPPTFIREVAKCMEDGAKKRSPYNWRESKVSAMQLADKVLRHVLDFIDGQDLTEDSRLSNLASAAADIAVILDAQKHNCLVDDRPSINTNIPLTGKYEYTKTTADFVATEDQRSAFYRNNTLRQDVTEWLEEEANRDQKRSLYDDSNDGGAGS